MKKRNRGRFLNYILCISLLAYFLSSNVMAMEMGDISGNDISGNVPGNAMTGSISGEEGDTIQEGTAEGNDVSGNDVSGNDVSGNDVSGNDALLIQEISLFAASDTRAGGSLSLNGYNGGGEIILEEDVTASGQCQLSGALTIDLNGHTMTMANGAYFMLSSSGAVLNIKDSAQGGVIYASCQLVWVYGGGTFNLFGGILDGSKMTSHPQQGGCVNLYRSNMGTNVFNMYGGTVRGFEATQYGGAVYVASTFSGRTPTFNMYGGTIEGCYAPAGAAVYVDNSGDGPGYFYIKGGTRQEQGGESKATIRCVSYNGKKVPNAIYNYGYLGMEGVVDIDGIVYLDQNNWASTVTHFIKVTGRLVVVGDGYIDVDTAYPNSNAVCTGHTVVENVTQTVGGTDNPISQEEFYTYGSYFINSTKGLMVSAGFDPSKNTIANGGPANWPSYQGDKYNTTYTYVDVMGQTMMIQASDSPGSKREMQNYNYLIYTERADSSQDYKTYYSVKISKRDIASDSALNGAVFSLKRKVVQENGSVSYENIGVSGITGDSGDGVEIGETYLYIGADKDGKLMLADGTYVLVEETAPSGYIARGELATIEIRHVMEESTGELVSVVEVMANNKVLTTTEQVINSSFGDKGWLVNKEIVLYLKNSTEVIEENTDYKIRIEKYEDPTFTAALGDAEFSLFTQEAPRLLAAVGKTNQSGVVEMQDVNGAVFTFSNGDSYELQESTPPQEYYAMDDRISVAVDENNQVLVDGAVLADGGTVLMAEGAASHGSWTATLNGELLTFKIYDEKQPPTWSLEARKYGTRQTEALALAGAEFTLYKLENGEGAAIETEVVSVISAEEADGNAKGILLFVDADGMPLKFDCNATYVLRETYAPLGYDLTEDIVLVINEDGSLIEVTQSGTIYEGASYDASKRILTLSIVDATVYHMPETGARGIYPFMAAGIILMCVSAVVLLVLYGNAAGKKESDDIIN